MKIKIFLTFWWFKLKEWTVGVNYIQGSRIPSDYPEYMWQRMGDPGECKYLSVADQIKQLKEIYATKDESQERKP